MDFSKLIETAPVAAAMIIVVSMFLKALEKRDDKLDSMTKEWGTNTRAIWDAAGKVVDRNTDAMMHNAAQIEKCRMFQNPGANDPIQK